jgi:catechol 2,3-dioxygenase
MSHAEPCFDVAQLAHTELLTPKPEESLWFFRDVLGMQETARAGRSVYLRAFEESYHHSLKLTEAPEAGMGHCAWRASSQAALQRRATAVETTGLGDGWSDGDLGHGSAYQFRTPDGHRMEVFWEVERASIPEGQRSLLKNRPQRRPLTGIPVRRIDHVNLLAEDVGATKDFLMDALGFRNREEILAPDGGLRAVWLSVSPLVHEIAVMGDGLGARARMHHLCYWYGTAQHLEDVADALLDHDVFVEVGPGVHGVTRAKFLYVREPGGNRIEFFGDTGYLILDPDAPTVTWDENDVDIVGTWIGPTLPDPTFYLYGTPPVDMPTGIAAAAQPEHA